MNDEVKLARGQIWYLKFNDAVGSEEAVGRPAIIVSAYASVDTLDIVTVVYLTRTPKKGGTVVEINSTKNKCWALCNQLYTVDKSRLLSIMTRASEAEMQKIDVALRKVLVLPVKNEESEQAYIAKIKELEDQLAGREVELAVHKRLYEKAVERLAEFKFVKDVPAIPTVKEPELDLSELQQKFPCVEKKQPKLKIEKVERVNVNTASAKEISAKTGMSLTVAYSITGTRKELGPYETLNDLLLADRFKQSHLDRYGELLEV